MCESMIIFMCVTVLMSADILLIMDFYDEEIFTCQGVIYMKNHNIKAELEIQNCEKNKKGNRIVINNDWTREEIRKHLF